MDTPDGFVPQAQHDAAMLALRAELSEAINGKQAEINELQRQVAEANAAALAQAADELGKLRTERDRFSAEATGFRNDNLALRKNLSDYLMSTTGGQAALREFNIMLLRNQGEFVQKKLTELGAL